MMDFYRLRRSVEDIWEFAQRILFEKSDAEKADIMYGHIARHLEKTNAFLQQMENKDHWLLYQ